MKSEAATSETHSEGDTPKRSLSAKTTQKGNGRHEFIDFIRKHRDLKKGEFPTDAALATAAGISPSSLSMLLDPAGTRTASARLAVKLAKVLCPRDQDLSSFTNEMLRLAGHEQAAPAHVREPIADRVQRERVIRAVGVHCQGFLEQTNRRDEPRGFAAEYVDLIARLMHASIRYEYCNLAELESVMREERCDIVVSCLLPTFKRQGYMAFSDPFPYLRAAMSAVARKGAQINGKDITVSDVLSCDSAASCALSERKVLLIDDEIGDEFANVFLPAMMGGQVQVVMEKSLDPKVLYKRLVEKEEADLLLADIATCSGVYKLGQERGKTIYPLSDHGWIHEHTAKDIDGANFPTLGYYPICFGLPRDDEKWLDMVNSAIKQLMWQGTRPLLRLYTAYFGMPPSIKEFYHLYAYEAQESQWNLDPAHAAFRNLFDYIEGRKPSSSATSPKPTLKRSQVAGKAARK